MKRPVVTVRLGRLSRYLQSQVGQAKQDVWSDLNG